MAKVKEIKVGDRFGKLTVIENILEKSLTSSRNTFHRMYRCVCDCGNEIIAPHKLLQNGHTSIHPMKCVSR